MAHFDEGGRIFTYAVLLDGIFRFTETGKECKLLAFPRMNFSNRPSLVGIDLLSKHTMHSCVATYTAFSGEFFIRRVKDRKDLDKPVSEQTTHPPADLENGPPNDEAPQDPSLYELIIDNE